MNDEPSPWRDNAPLIEELREKRRAALSDFRQRLSADAVIAVIFDGAAPVMLSIGSVPSATLINLSFNILQKIAADCPVLLRAALFKSFHRSLDIMEKELA